MIPANTEGRVDNIFNVQIPEILAKQDAYSKKIEASRKFQIAIGEKTEKMDAEMISIKSDLIEMKDAIGIVSSTSLDASNSSAAAHKLIQKQEARLDEIILELKELRGSHKSVLDLSVLVATLDVKLDSIKESQEKAYELYPRMTKVEGFISGLKGAKVAVFVMVSSIWVVGISIYEYFKRG